MKNAKIPEDECTIRVWGYTQKNNKGFLEKKMRIDMHAQITAFNLKLLQNFKNLFDKKERVLGTGKLHVKFEFEQVAAVTTSKIFDALYDEYDYILHQIQSEFPLLTIDYYRRKFNKGSKVFIKVRGPERDQLLGPAMRINKLFSPKIVKMEESHFRFLDWVEEGQNILDELEWEYEYKIYFAFERRSNAIKLFCEDR